MNATSSLAIRLFLSAAVAALLLTVTAAQQQTARNQPRRQQAQPSEDDFPMPARDRYFRIQDQLKSIRSTSSPAASELYRKLNKASEEMRKEIAALNKRIFESRQAELMRRARASVPEGRKLGFDVLTYPRVDGSTSAHPLGMLIACRLIGAEYEWTALRVHFNRVHPMWSGSGVPFNLEKVLSQYRLLARIDPTLRERRGAIINQLVALHHGTHGAYVNVIAGKADMGLVARRPSPDETRSATDKGVALDIQPVALDAFVFIVNRANRVRGLSTGQLKDVYTGKVTSWKALGGADHEIKAYQRNPTSGSQELMRTVFMKGQPPVKPHRRLLRNSMGGPYNALTRDVHGLAYTVYFYEHFMSASPYTRTLAVDGVMPGSETIRSGKYPYVTKVYSVIRKDEPADSSARRLRDWLLSAEGQAVVAESGYVPLAQTGRTVRVDPH